MIVAALAVIPAVVLDATVENDAWATAGAVLNWAIWLAFAAELVYLLWRTPKRAEWLWRHPLDVALVVLTPPFLPGVLQALRAARLARLLRVLRLIRLARTVRTMHALFSTQGVAWAALLTLLVIIGGGAAFAQAESTTAKDVSLDDGIWWALTTVTTVGYGDFYPHTQTGKVIGALVMFSGIGFVALVTAAAAQRFLATAEAVEAEESTILVELREIRAELQHLRANKPHE